jgi:hypothetical protein
MSYPPPPPGGYPVPPVPPPQPKRRSPIWTWLLGGCGVCMLLLIIGMVVMGTMMANWVRSATGGLGPVNPTTVQQQLGDVPLYPNGTLNVPATQGSLTAFRLMEKAAGKEPGGIFRGAAVMDTGDAPDAVLQYYDQELRGRGWTPADAGRKQPAGRQVEQKAYRKGNEVVMIQAQPAAKGSTVIIMRGGPEMQDKAPAAPPSGGP